MTSKKTMGKKILAALADFSARLKRGESFEMTQLRREETPDGPLHTVRKFRCRLPRRRPPAKGTRS